MTDARVGMRVRRGRTVGLVTRVAPGGHHVMVRVGARDRGVMRAWPVAECREETTVEVLDTRHGPVA